MEFSTRLKKLLKAGNLKMKDLSSYLSYDLSYISKWVNGKCLPSLRTADETIVRMSKFFAINLYNTEAQNIVSEITGIDTSVDRLARLEKYILSILTDGYYYSLDKEEDSEFDSESGMRLNGRKDDIVQDVSKELKKIIAGSDSDLEIYFTIGRLRFFLDLIKEFKSFVWIKKNSIKLKFVISPDCYKKILDSSMAMLYMLINTVIFFDIEIVVADIPRDNGYIYVKNKCFFDLRLNIHGEAISMVQSINQDLFKEYSMLTETHSYKERVIMKSRDIYDIDEDFNEYLATNSPIDYILYVSYFDGLVPKCIMKEIIESSKFTGLDKHIIEQSSEYNTPLYSMPKGILNISKKGIFEAIRKREVAIGGRTLNLQEHHMDEYIKSIIGTFREMEDVEINFIKDDISPLKIFDNNIIMFTTKNYLSIKKNPRYNDSKINGYFEVLDEDICFALYNALKSQNGSEYFEDVTKDNLEKYLEYAKNGE